jgi:microcystin-dependent protein
MEGFIGQIILFAGNFAPRNWAFCQGQLISIAQNTALFSILGTTYGGDGRTTFGLPDLQGRTAMHPGNGPGLPSYRLGQKGGTTTNTLNATQLPSHTHAATASVHLGTAANVPSGSDAYLPISTGANFFSNAKGNANLNAGSTTVTVGNTGNNQQVNNMQPSLSIYYVICMVGVYPSRS